MHKTPEKDFGIVTFDLIGLLPTNYITNITMAYTGVCEETFDINSKLVAQTTQNFIVGKSNLQEMANFVNLPGDFRL